MATLPLFGELEGTPNILIPFVRKVKRCVQHLEGEMIFNHAIVKSVKIYNIALNNLCVSATHRF